jgi:hypothetical protein
MNNQKELNLYFQIAPSDMAGAGAIALMDPLPLVQNGTWSDPDISCQRILVNWFLTLAFAHIHQILRITLSDHIKDSVRAKWEAIFQNECNSISHDLSSDIQHILSTPWQHL